MDTTGGSGGLFGTIQTNTKFNVFFQLSVTSTGDCSTSCPQLTVQVKASTTVLCKSLSIRSTDGGFVFH